MQNKQTNKKAENPDAKLPFLQAGDLIVSRIPKSVFTCLEQLQVQMKYL